MARSHDAIIDFHLNMLTMLNLEEDYGRKLLIANVPVNSIRMNGAIHGFMSILVLQCEEILNLIETTISVLKELFIIEIIIVNKSLFELYGFAFNTSVQHKLNLEFCKITTAPKLDCITAPVLLGCTTAVNTRQYNCATNFLLKSMHI
jgi:hypothetical protein